MSPVEIVSLVLALFVLAFSIRSFIFFLRAKKVLPNILISKIFSVLSKIYVSENFPSLNLKYERLTFHPVEPFVSILIPTYNECSVINRLMSSCANLIYGRNNFEIIIVDDSTDKTLHELKKWQVVMPNLRIFHRPFRDGWKSGALNQAIKKMNKKSEFALIVDADHVIEKFTLKKFVDCFAKSKNKLDVVQGFPVPSIGSKENWIARGVYFRLVKRNLVEYVAKNEMHLPLQITGSLFMIRSDFLKKVKFSHDLTEDWELTLDLHLKHHKSNYKRILFYPAAVAYCETPVKMYTYFKQRLRVSEGHTRGFKKQFLNILKSPLPPRKKIELFFTGSQYAKFLLISALLVADSIWPFTNDIMSIGSSLFFVSSLLIQAFTLLLYVLNNMAITHLLGNQFNYKDVWYLIAINACTFPAFVIGSARGIIKKKGTFHKTERIKSD